MSNRPLAGALLVGYVAGAIPVFNIVAGMLKGFDLRRTGPGAVSPSNLYYVAGLCPAVIAGLSNWSRELPAHCSPEAGGG